MTEYSIVKECQMHILHRGITDNILCVCVLLLSWLQTYHMKLVWDTRTRCEPWFPIQESCVQFRQPQTESYALRSRDLVIAKVNKLKLPNSCLRPFRFGSSPLC